MAEEIGKNAFSPEMLADLEETFVIMSNNGDIKGYVMGDCLSRMMLSMGLVFPSTLHQYYLEEGKKEKIYFENFLRHAQSCVNKQENWMKMEQEQCFDYFVAKGRNANKLESNILDSQELHGWLTNLGEHIDNNAVEAQLHKQMYPDDDVKNCDPGMKLEHFQEMCSKNIVDT